MLFKYYTLYIQKKYTCELGGEGGLCKREGKGTSVPFQLSVLSPLVGTVDVALRTDTTPHY